MLQVIGTFVDGPLPVWAIVLYQIVTLLSYTNSAINPVLYAFLTDNFRRNLAESFQRSSRTANSSVVARGLAMCSHALYVSVQHPIFCSPPADKPPIKAALSSFPDSAEPNVDEQKRTEDDGEADVVKTASKAVLTTSWIEHGQQSPTIELHVVYEDLVSD